MGRFERKAAMTRTGIFVSLAALAAATACMPKPEPQPAPEPPPAAELAPPAPTPTPTPAGDWRDGPVTPGEWRYDATRTLAEFGPRGGAALFSMRCDLASRQMVLTRTGPTSGTTLRIRTFYGFRSLPLETQAGSPQLVTRVPAADRVLDGMAFSRGRFLIEATGAPTLVIPAWTEPSRVIEDCRA